MWYSALKVLQWSANDKTSKNLSDVINADDKNSYKLSFSYVQFVEPNLFVILYASKRFLCLSTECVCVCVCVCVWHQHKGEQMMTFIGL